MSMIQGLVEGIGKPVCETIFPLLDDKPMGSFCEEAALGMGSVAIAALVIVGGFVTAKAFSSRKVEPITEVQISDPSLPAGAQRVINFLKDHAIDLKDPKNGNTILMVACQEGSLNAVLEALKHSPDVNLANDQGDTALHFACQKAHREIVEALIKNGADTKAENAEGKTPLRMIDESNEKFHVFFIQRVFAKQRESITSVRSSTM